MKKLAILFFSTSRYEFLFPTLESIDKFVDFAGVEVYKIFIDDYPRTRDSVLLDYIKDKYKIDKMILNETNLGQSVTWAKFWSLLPKDTDYIWQQEDDLEILEPINVLHMIETLEKSPVPLYQICLKRNICYEGSNDYVYKIEEEGDGEELNIDGQWIVKFRSKWFIAHPGIYPKWVADLDYKYNPQEGVLPSRILKEKPDSYGAIWGKRKDPFRIKHLGEYTHGMRCAKGEPGYESFKKYDSCKDYYSLGSFAEWKGSRNYQMAKLHEQLKNNNDSVYLNLVGAKEKIDDIIDGYYKTSTEEDGNTNLKYYAAMHLKDYNRAIKIDPDRLEAWHELMMSHRDNVHVAYGYGKHGYIAYKKAEQDNIAKLPSEPHSEDTVKIYNYRFIFEYSMICYYSKNRKDIAEVAANITKIPSTEYIWDQHQSNMRFYKNQDSDTNANAITEFRVSPYNAPSVIIIDNFFKDPMKERAFALAQEYPVKGNYPGRRTKSFATEDDKKMLETIIGKKITYWPDNYNGSYQFCTAGMKSWIHRDRTTCSAMIYLTPDPPANSGTKTYIHKATKGTFEKDDVNGVLGNDSNNFDAWHVCDVIENKFNRLAIFQGIHSHMSADYFGDCLENARLFKIYFFNIDTSPYPQGT